jgi:hypothetical protein
VQNLDGNVVKTSLHEWVKGRIVLLESECSMIESRRVTFHYTLQTVNKPPCSGVGQIYRGRVGLQSDDSDDEMMMSRVSMVSPCRSEQHRESWVILQFQVRTKGRSRWQEWRTLKQ